MYHFVRLYSQNTVQTFSHNFDRGFICDFNTTSLQNIIKPFGLLWRERDMLHTDTQGNYCCCTDVTIRVEGGIRLRFERQFITDT